jgi:hypothetical protein
MEPLVSRTFSRFERPTSRRSGAEAVFEINMEQLAARLPTFFSDHPDHLSSDSSKAIATRDHHVLNPGVSTSVPHNIDESHQACVVPGNDPSEAVPSKNLGPIPFVASTGSRIKDFSVESIDLGIFKPTAPLKGRCHPKRLSTVSNVAEGALFEEVGTLSRHARRLATCSRRPRHPMSRRYKDAALPDENISRSSSEEKCSRKELMSSRVGCWKG